MDADETFEFPCRWGFTSAYVKSDRAVALGSVLYDLTDKVVAL